MTPDEKSRELQAWERLASSSDYAITMNAYILQKCDALLNEMLGCDDDKLPAVRKAYKEMCALRDYPEKRIAELRKLPEKMIASAATY